MASSLLLPHSAIIELTGKVRPSAQIRALRQMGFVVHVRPDGKPLVSLGHYRQVMGDVHPNTTALKDCSLHLEGIH